MAEHSDDDITQSFPDDGDGDGTELVIREFNNPRRGHIFPRDGIFVGPSMERVTKFEWRFYDAGSNHYQDYIWTAASNPIEQPALHFKHGKNAIHHRYVRYSDNQQTEWFDTGWWNFVEGPKHDYSNVTVFDTSHPTLTGTAEPGAQCILYMGNKKTPISNLLPANASGVWSIPIQAELYPGPHTLILRMMVDGWLGDAWSSLIEIVVYPRPTITRPNEFVDQPSTDIIFSGDCTPGSTITVVSALNPDLAYSEAKKFDTPHWELRSKTGLKFDEGLWRIRVKYEYPGIPGGLSAVHSFTVKDVPVEPKPPPVPAINFPDILSIQNQKFPAWGYGGVAGAKVKCFLDGETIIRGQTTAIDNYWRADIELPPGTRSLVVEQTLNGMASGRSIARAFRIRPPEGGDGNIRHSY